MNLFKKRCFLLLFSGFCCLGTTISEAKRKQLTIYCGTEIAQCELMVREFRKRTGAEVSMVRKAAGEAFAQILAEKKNPKADVWWGGTGDNHLQAAEEGLTEPYQSPLQSQLYDWAIAPAKATGNRTVGIYMGAIAIGYNPELLRQKKLPEPKCWKDLIQPIYRGEIQIANPGSSGTAYTMLATIIQLFGEEEGFRYLKELNKNVNQYTKSGSAAINAVSRKETALAVAFVHGVVNLQEDGFPIKYVIPCEGTGYEIGSVSIIKGAKNLEVAKEWVDFTLDPKVQSLWQTVKAYQIPSNKLATVPTAVPKMETLKLIRYDQQKYGSKQVQRHLLDRWEKEVKAASR